MKRNIVKHAIFLVGLILSWLNSIGQVMTISEGALSTQGNSVLSLSETKLHCEGKLISLDESLYAFNSANTLAIEGNGEFTFQNLIFQGNLELNSNVLVNNINFINGNLDLTNSFLSLHGMLINETNSARALADGLGEITKVVDLEYGVPNELGNLGLTVTAQAELSSLEFRRGHIIQESNGDYSISRYYKIPSLDQTLDIEIEYLEPELEGLNSEYLEIRSLTNDEWHVIYTIEHETDPNKFLATLSPGTTIISLFKGTTVEGVVVSGGISPNNDSFNDKFIITGIEDYPNNKLIIMNRWGDILLEKAQYNNDWGGENVDGVGIANKTILPDGTYFYIFFKDANDKNSVLRGSFEIRSGN